MERTVYQQQHLVSLRVAFANFVVFLCLFLISHGWALQLLESRLREEAQVNLKLQKNNFQAVFDTNFVLLRALETLILERKNTEVLDLTTKNLAQQLLPLSKSLLALGFATGNPQQLWTSSDGVFKNQNTKLGWDDQRPFQQLAQKALLQRKTMFELLIVNQKELLLMTQPVFDKGQLWGFVFAEIDFARFIQEFVSSRRHANLTLHLLIPESLNPEFRQPPTLDSVVLSTDLPNQDKAWTLYATPNTQWYVPVFPAVIAVPMMIAIALFIGLTVYLLQSERLKSRWLSLFDPLTGIANRRHLEQFFGKIVQDRKNYSLLLFNIDNFRAINEKYGFAVGDQILIEVAALLRQSVQATDFLARLGGDEFVILVPPSGGVTNITYRIQKLMTEPILINNQMISLVTIIGLSHYPEHGTDLNSLVEYADHHILRDNTLEN